MRIAIVAGDCRGYIRHTGLDIMVRSLGLELQKLEQVDDACIVIPYLGCVDRHSKYCTAPELCSTDDETNSKVYRGRLLEDDENPDDCWAPVYIIDSGHALASVTPEDGKKRITWDKGGAKPRCGKNGVFLDKDLAKAMLRFNRAAAAWLLAGGPGWVPDVVHCFSWEAALASACLAEVGCKRPATVLTVDLLTFQGIVPGAMLRPGKPDTNFLAEGIRKSDLILLPSSQWLEDVQRESVSERLQPDIRTKCASGRASVAPFTIIPELFREISRDYGAFRHTCVDLDNRAEVSTWARSILRSRLPLEETKGPTFLVGNRVTEDDQKNYEAVHDVMDVILNEYPETKLILRLLPARDPTKPKSDAMWEKLERLSSKYGRRVAITPEGDERVNWNILINGADILLMPSRFEPAGLNHLQAMCVGTPVIGTAKGGMADALRDTRADPKGGNGWFFRNPDDRQAFAKCCRDAVSAFDDPKRWALITENAYRGVKSLRDVIVEYYFPAYRSALAHRGT